MILHRAFKQVFKILASIKTSGTCEKYGRKVAECHFNECHFF